MSSELHNGCPLSKLSPEEKGYCGTCPQKHDCIFWTILRKLEDVEAQLMFIKTQVRQG